MDITCLSIQQPWAWLIIEGHKPIENRNWYTPFRGKFYVHASKRFNEEAYYWVKSNFPISLPRMDEFERGVVLGSVDLTKVISHSNNPWFSGRFGFVLIDPKKVDPFPARGQLGFFKLEISKYNLY